uniref:Putative secreted protein n=1 Tax=Anopheles darlingi TaxID=43151 RepID=A0A2M4DF21_ANODA
MLIFLLLLLVSYKCRSHWLLMSLTVGPRPVSVYVLSCFRFIACQLPLPTYESSGPIFALEASIHPERAKSSV